MALVEHLVNALCFERTDLGNLISMPFKSGKVLLLKCYPYNFFFIKVCDVYMQTKDPANLLHAISVVYYTPSVRAMPSASMNLRE